MEIKLKKQIEDLCSEYGNAKRLYDGAGLDAVLKESALQAMANILQLQQLALSNYAMFINAQNACERYLKEKPGSYISYKS
jgi:hypothetical protein